MTSETITRCAWLNPGNGPYTSYHDTEWGVPVHDDRKLFEMLVLEGAQAGLSWETILTKREGYRKAFFGFDIRACSSICEEYEFELLANAGIVRNRLKIASVRSNARAFIKIQESFGSFDEYIWAYVGNKPQQPCFTAISDIPTASELSITISKDLKAKGMKFVGATIIYAYMQAVGMINAHTTDCFRHSELLGAGISD